MDLNIGEHYDTSTGAFTAPVEGLYYFSTQLFDCSTDGYFDYIYFYKNGVSTGVTDSGDASYRSDPDFSATMYLYAGDYIDVRAGDSDDDVCGNSNAKYTYFHGHLIKERKA